MKNNTMGNAALIAVISATLLTGCLYGQCIDGPCALTRAELLDSIKPYLHYWVNPKTSEQQRKLDSLACGTAATPYAITHVVFDRHIIDAHIEPGENTDRRAYVRVLNKWERCMLDKRYAYTGTCPDNQISRNKPGCIARLNQRP